MSDFLKALQLKYPLIVAPMAGGVTTPELVIASSTCGALGSVGAAYYKPQILADFVAKIRRETDRPFAINLFVPHAEPDLSKLSDAIRATASYRAELGLPEPKMTPPYQEDFIGQFEAMLRVKPAVFSFVFGLPPAGCIAEAKKQGIFTIGTATTLHEAEAVQDASADAVTLQGIEAGGHRGIFERDAEDEETALHTLLDQCRTKIRIPLIAAGGIMNAEDIRKALSKGAAVVQMGTAFLTCKESGASVPYRAALSGERKTRTTRVFSGRLARGIENRFMKEMENAPILPFPAQNKFTRDLRDASAQKGLADFLSLWSGTGKGKLWEGSTAELIGQLFEAA